MIYFFLAILLLIVSEPFSTYFGSDIFKLAPTALLALGVAKYGFFQKGYFYIGRIEARKELFAYFLFFLIYIFSFLRAPFQTTVGMASYLLQIIFMVLFLYLFCAYHFKYSKDSERLFSRISMAVIIAPAVFIVLNLILYLMGIRSTTPTSIFEAGTPPSLLASVLGMDLNRTGFLFTGHPNSFANIVGFVFCTSLVYLLISKARFGKKFLLLGIISACAFVLLLVDSRGALGGVVATLFIIFFATKLRLRKLLPGIVFLIPFIPFLTLLALSSFGERYLDELSRNPTDLATGNGRAIIWYASAQEFSDPKPIHFIGYGQMGHYTAGTSKSWAYIFSSYDIPETAVTHNLFFQSLFDLGYVGLFAFLLLLFLSLRASVYLYDHGNKYGLIFAAFIVYFMFSGIFESIFGIYNRLYTNILFIFSFIPILFKNYHLAKKND